MGERFVVCVVFTGAIFVVRMGGLGKSVCCVCMGGRFVVCVGVYGGDICGSCGRSGHGGRWFVVLTVCVVCMVWYVCSVYTLCVVCTWVNGVCWVHGWTVCVVSTVAIFVVRVGGLGKSVYCVCMGGRCVHG